MAITPHNPAKRRPPAVAGLFYPGLAAELLHVLEDLLGKVHYNGRVPKALIVPHAGYVFSGPTAARAYIALQSIRKQVRRVVLLGPAHRVYTRGLALSSADYFTTPLGDVEVDHEAIDTISDLPQVITFDETHKQEHSLEVHLPFLQVLFDDFRIIPLVVGETSPEVVAGVLSRLWGGEETVIIVSSDLSHYHNYETARNIDRTTTLAIEQLQLEKIGSQQACGCMPVRGLLQLAREKKMSVKTLDLCNSGDTAGSRDRVVGYGAYAFYAQ